MTTRVTKTREHEARVLALFEGDAEMSTEDVVRKYAAAYHPGSTCWDHANHVRHVIARLHDAGSLEQRRAAVAGRPGRMAYYRRPSCSACGNTRTITMTNGRDVFRERCTECAS